VVTRFFLYEEDTDYDEVLVNLDDVRRVRPSRSVEGKDETVLEFKDGTKATLPGNRIDRLHKLSLPVIPAAPGCFLVSFVFDDETPSEGAVISGVDRAPIVAWRLEDGWPGAEPIVIDPVETSPDEGESATLFPSGDIVALGGSAWLNIDAWARYVCAGWKEWHNRRKAAE